ncbi:MAG: glycosyltransferase, partial [Raoultibacter sp.]
IVFFCGSACSGFGTLQGGSKVNEYGITVVMAVYNPRPDWLREQLLSLNAQTDRDVILCARDDGSTSISFAALQAIFAECITTFPYRLTQNAQNQGSNATFAALTAEVTTPYIAYCDQDDVWEPHKLQRSRQTLCGDGCELVCSDVSIIDGEGRQTAPSLTSIKPHIHYLSGDDLAPVFLTTNFVTGCTVLMKTDLAQSALPFPSKMVYDHWLGMVAAHRGKIVALADTLVRHRMHNSNQTLTMAGIATKSDYLQKRILPYAQQMDMLHSRIDLGMSQRQAEAWAHARVENAQHGSAKALFALKHVSPSITWFELLMRWLPNSFFAWLIRCMQKGVL